VHGVPVLGTVPRGVSGTEAGIGGHRVMPSIPFTELALSHAKRRRLRAWGIEEEWVRARSDLTDPLAPSIIPPMRMPGKYTLPDTV